MGPHLCQGTPKRDFNQIIRRQENQRDAFIDFTKPLYTIIENVINEGSPSQLDVKTVSINMRWHTFR